MQTKFKRRFTKKNRPLSAQQEQLYRYHAAKNQWLAFHPHATQHEVEIALLRIAREHAI